MQAPKSLRASQFEQHARTADFLPPAFELLPRLLVLLDDPEINSDTLADIIRVDAGLTANVLRVANSSAFGGGTKIDSLPQAIIRLGLREIYRLLATIIASPNVMSLDGFGFERVDLWQHSVSSAIAAQLIAQHITGPDTEVAYTTGLLHDIGKVVMAQFAKADYLVLLESCKDNNQPHYRAEQQTYGIDHAQIGSMILKRWRFPDEIIHAIKFHHDISRAPEEASKLAAIIFASNIVSYRLNFGSGFPDYAVDPDPAILEIIGLRPGDLSEYEHLTVTAFQHERQRLTS
jgi:putative nucleotidyltransferase with HDIG domain